jgi:murein DD-endopeptidase MepM/ murein hydrolase activator NlpD
VISADGDQAAPNCTSVSARQPYDQKQETPANRRVAATRGPYEWDWSFDVDGSLALAPEVASALKDHTTSDSVEPMAWPEAPGLAARAAMRERKQASARRARRIAALAVLATLALVVLLLSAFGMGDTPVVGTAGPAPAQRLLPSGPPQPQIIAMRDTLRIQLPVNQARVTSIGFHASGTAAVALEPVGSQANAGVFGRIVQRLVGDDGSGVRYYLLEGGLGPQTGGLDVGAPVDTDVYAPVDGTVIAISDRIVNGRPYGKRLDVQPSGNPGVVVSLLNLQVDPALTVGSSVVAARTKIGRVIDLSSVERAGLARYTHDDGQHIHLEVHPAASVASP